MGKEDIPVAVECPDTLQHSHWFGYSYDQELWVCSCGAFRDRFTGTPMKCAVTPTSSPDKEQKEKS